MHCAPIRVIISNAPCANQSNEAPSKGQIQLTCYEVVAVLQHAIYNKDLQTMKAINEIQNY